MFLTTCSNVCSHHLYLGIEWSIKYASVFSLCLGRANESRFLTVGGFKKLLYYFLLWKPCECNPRIHYTITTVASTGTCLVPRRFNPPKSINIHPVAPLSPCFTLFHLCLRLGPQSWCATCRLLPIDCSPGGQPILHQGVSALYPSTREGLEVWDGVPLQGGVHMGSLGMNAPHAPTTATCRNMVTSGYTNAAEYDIAGGWPAVNLWSNRNVDFLPQNIHDFSITFMCVWIFRSFELFWYVITYRIYMWLLPYRTYMWICVYAFYISLYVMLHCYTLPMFCPSDPRPGITDPFLQAKVLRLLRLFGEKNAEPRQPRCLKSHRTNDIHGIWCKQIARIGNVWVNSGNLVYPYCSAPKTFWEGVNTAQKQFQIQSQKVLGAVGYSIIHELLRGWIIRIPSGRPWHHYRWVDGGETIPVSLYFSSVKYHSKR